MSILSWFKDKEVSDDGQSEEQKLYNSCETGNIGEVKKILKAHPHVADWVNTAEEGRTPLYVASREGHTEIVDLLLKSKANPNAKKEDRATTSLHVASQNGHLGVVRLLLSSNADVNARRENGWTPLFFATQHRHCEIVKELLSSNANPNIRNKNGATPLIIASQKGFVEVVQLLLSAKAEVDFFLKDTESTALSSAAKRGHLEVVKVLLAAKANVNALRKDGTKPGEVYNHSVPASTRKEISQLITEERKRKATREKRLQDRVVLIKCQFGDEFVKMPCEKVTTFDEFVRMVEEEWGPGKEFRYIDADGDLVKMKRTKELMWVREKRSVVVQVVLPKENQVSESDSTRKIAELKDQLEAANSANLALEGQLADAQKEKKILECDLEQQQHQQQFLLSNAAREIANLRVELEAARMMNVNANQHQEEKSFPVSDSTQQIADLRVELEELKGTLRELKGKNE